MRAEDAEAAIARALDGKFFLTDGRELGAVKRQQESMTAHARAEAAIKQQERRMALMARNTARMELGELRRISDDITPRRILLAVSFAHGVPISDILGPARGRKIIHARQHACHAMRNIAKMKFPAIGDELARDHTTALHSCNTWAHLQTRFPKCVEIVNRILLEGAGA